MPADDPLPHRLGVAAVIVRDERRLLVEFVDGAGLHYNLPGGGVEPGETLQEALHRELWEECRATANVGRLLLAWEYDPAVGRGRFGRRPKLVLVFHCTLHADSQPRTPEEPDEYQTGIAWVSLGELAHTPLLPFVGDLLCSALAAPLVNPFTVLDAPHLTAPGYSERLRQASGGT